MDQVGESSGGCNPWPILEEDKTETDSEIKISYEFLKESSDIFPNFQKLDGYLKQHHHKGHCNNSKKSSYNINCTGVL